MLFHNEPINTSDRAFHIRYGYLPVVEVHEAYFVASGPNGKRHHVSTDGMTMGAQLFFWHNPWVVIPPKDNSTWNKVTAIATAAATVLR